MKKKKPEERIWKDGTEGRGQGKLGKERVKEDKE